MTHHDTDKLALDCERAMVAGAVRRLERFARDRRLEATKEGHAEADRFADAARYVAELMPQDGQR